LISYKSLVFKRIGERLYDYIIHSKELCNNKVLTFVGTFSFS
jgi:hypothetical protein